MTLRHRMRHRDRSGALALLLAMVGALLLPGTGTTALSPPAHAQPEASPQLPQTLARIELTEMSPRLVTVTSAPVLRVSGRVVNVGDRSLTKLAVRLQRDEPVTDDEAALTAVREIPEALYVTRFRPVPGDLAPGESSPFQLEVPLRGGAALESLQIGESGVYPLLVNLNGKPDYGGVARLASVPLLLPVLGLPAPVPGGPPGPALAAPAQPIPLTVIWPLAAEPARLPTGPGEPILISSDDPGRDPLAVQVAPGGRLDGLVGALEQVVPPGSPLAAAVCVTIDPLLLETIDGMSRGYQVAHPHGISAGTGAHQAQVWLDRLRAAVQGRCVLPLPYADPDLVALSRAGLTDLAALAGGTGTRLVRDLLGVQPLTQVSWPAGGVLDERTLAELAAWQTRAVLLQPRALAGEPLSADVVSLATGLPDSASAEPIGVLIDPLLTSALDPGASVTLGVQQPGNAITVATRPTDTADPLAAQDGLGALVYRAAADPNPQPVLLAPPRRWQASGTEATELLHTARELLSSGFFAPRELAQLVGSRPPGPGVAVSYPPEVGATEVPPAVTMQVRQAHDVVGNLQVATQRDATANLEPAELFDPLRLGLLRGVSSAWQGQPDQAARVIAEVRARLAELRRAVRIVPAPGAYTLAASDSPLLLTVSNELPVVMQVQLRLAETTGLRAGTVGPALVPARSTRQFVIPAQVSRAGQFSIGVRLSTPSGTPLGEPSTLQLRSTAFGTVTIALTASAGALLIVLVARRIARRMRRSGKPAAQDTPAPHGSPAGPQAGE